MSVGVLGFEPRTYTVSACYSNQAELYTLIRKPSDLHRQLGSAFKNETIVPFSMEREFKFLIKKITIQQLLREWESNPL